MMAKGGKVREKKNDSKTIQTDRHTKRGDRVRRGSRQAVLGKMKSRMKTSHAVHEMDKHFTVGLAADPAIHSGGYEMKTAMDILEEARRPVELSESRQGKLARLSDSLKRRRPQLVTLDEHQRNLLKGGSLVAKALTLRDLYRAVEEACPIVMPTTKSALLIVDPLDDERLVSETLSRVFQITAEKSVVGHVAATGESLNMAIADMSEWPTKDPRDDDGLDPNQFHQSYSRDPTKSVVCVPVRAYNAEQSILGVLYAENEAKKQHFKRSGARKASHGSKKKGIDNRARAPPYTRENEDALVVLSKYVSASLAHIMNGDVQNSFAKHAARFRDIRKKHKCLKKFEQAVQRRRQKKYDSMRDQLAQREKEIKDLQAEVETMRTGFQDMQLALQASKESEEKAIKEKTETSNKNKLLEAELKMTSANLEKYKGQAALLTTRSKELAQRLKDKTRHDTEELEKLEERLEHYNLLLRKAETDAKHEKAERIIKTLILQSESRAFRGWHDGAKVQTHQRNQAKRLMARAMNRTMAYNFDKFVKIWKDGKQARAQKKRALAYFKNRELTMVWGSWQAYVRRRLFVRHFLNKMVRQWENKEIAKGINGWKAFYAWHLMEEKRRLEEEENARNRKSRSKFCTVL